MWHRSIFPSFQDGQLLKDVQEAAKWKELWSCISVFLVKVREPLEKGRRWGLVCNHPECDELRRQHKPVKCPMASRRLKEVRDYLRDLVSLLYQTARGLTLDQCEGCEWLATATSRALRKIAADLELKTLWTRRVPWLMANGDVPEQAAKILKQLLDTVDSKLDSLSLWYKSEFVTDLQAFNVLTCFAYRLPPLPTTSPAVDARQQHGQLRS